MPDEPYTLSDLASLADVTPRTIRYYVAQGLLPSPEAAGPATRYGEGHLVRLRVIKRLQRDHLPLSEIRARLEHMGEDEIELLLNEAPATPPAPEETLAFVQDLMTQAGVGPRAAGSRAASQEAATPRRSLLKRIEPVGTFEPMSPESFPLRAEPALASGQIPAPMPSAPPQAQPGSAPPTSPSLPVAPGKSGTPYRST
jgi:Ca-activated chloride channel family protein